MMTNPIPPPLNTTAQDWPWTVSVNPSVYDKLPHTPSISVLIPSYNQGIFLEECIRSLLAQNYPYLEILLVDGGSNDSSTQIIEYYRQNLTWAVSEPDKGTWDADNKALAKATGEYILVVNSDDLLLENGLFHLLRTLLSLPDAHWVTGKVQAINRSGEIKAVFTPKQPAHATTGRSFIAMCWIYHPSTLVRRSLIGRFHESDLMDWELWIRLEREGYLPTLCPCSVAALRFHSDSKSFDTISIYKSNIKLLEQIASEYTDGLLTEISTYKRLLAEARMVQEIEAGNKLSALKYWCKELVLNLNLLTDRPFLGLGKRLLQGKVSDLYKPMAFLDEPYIPSPADAPCAL